MLPSLPDSGHLASENHSISFRLVKQPRLHSAYNASDSCHISAENILSSLECTRELNDYNSSSVLDAHYARMQNVSLQEFRKHALIQEWLGYTPTVRKLQRTLLSYPNKNSSLDLDSGLQYALAVADAVKPLSNHSRPVSGHSSRGQSKTRHAKAPVKSSLSFRRASPVISSTHAQTPCAPQADYTLDNSLLFCVSNTMEKDKQPNDDDELTREKLDDFSDYITDEWKKIAKVDYAKHKSMQIDLRVYHKDIVLVNNWFSKSYTTTGLQKYLWEVNKLRYLLQWKYESTQLQVLTKTINVKESSVKLRWRIVAKNKTKIIKLPFVSKIEQDETWLDGICVMYVNPDLYITKHVIEKFDTEQKGKKTVIFRNKLESLIGRLANQNSPVTTAKG